MHWLFKIDTRQESGLGHFFRSLAIAEELAKIAKVDLELSEDSIFFKTKVTSNSISVVEGSPQNIHYSGVFFDGYQYSNNDIIFYKNQGCATVILDDQGNQNTIANLTIHPVSERNKFQYAIVQSKFYRNNIRPIKETTSSLLIMFGGVDSSNMTMRILEVIEEFCLNNAIIIKIVITSRNTHRFKLEQYLASQKKGITLLIDDLHVDETMESVDLIIGNGGVGLLERIALHKPSITIVTSRNQRLQAEVADSLGMTFVYDHFEGLDKKSFISKLAELCFHKGSRLAMSNSCREYFDFGGAKRIVNELLKISNRRTENA